MNSDQVQCTASEPSEAEQLRLGIDAIADELCAVVDGNVDVSISIDSDDETLQKLTMLVNFVLGVAHRAVKKSDARALHLRTILDTASEGFVSIDQKGIVRAFNQSAARMFGYQAEEVLGQNVSMLMPLAEADNHDDYIAQYLRSGIRKVVGLRRELEGLRKDGTQFPMELALGEVPLEGGHIFTAILRDLTKQKQLQSELAQAQKLESIGQLAAGVAHEINTPMQYVCDNIEYLSDCSEQLFAVIESYRDNLFSVEQAKNWPDRQREISEIIDRTQFNSIREQVPLAITESLEGARRVINIVRAMKEFSHPGGNEKSPVDLNQAIHSAATITRNRWKYVADLKLDLDGQLPHVMCLPAEINQVLLNLLVNAADAVVDKFANATQEKGLITVRTQCAGDEVAIEVEDTGCGIPDHLQGRIFDPFFTTKEVGKGTGQGLTICYNVVVNKHSGSITVHSQLGVGTKFRVTLPIGDGMGFSIPDGDRDGIGSEPLQSIG